MKNGRPEKERKNLMKKKTEVINDPLGQPIVPAGSEDLFCFYSILKSGHGRMYEQHV